jgi:hypothetical protein
MRTQDILADRASEQRGSLDTLTPGDFSSQDNMDRRIAELLERDDRERADRERIRQFEAANAAILADAERDLNITKTLPWLDYTSLDEHPAVAAAIEAKKRAERAFETVVRAADKAHAALDAAESLAARGTRDDAALVRAQTALERSLSEQRIAAKAVEHADADLDYARRRARADASVNLRAIHVPEIQKLDAALVVAAEHSNRATAIEKASSRLLMLPWDSAKREELRGLGSPLMPASWKKDFNLKNGLLRYWREIYQKLGYLRA